MVLLVNVVCALIFCMNCHFSIGVAENDSENVMCPKKACQEPSNPFDITRNDAVNGLKHSETHKTNPGDMFRDIGGNENIKKVSEVHDNGYYTSLCWIEITTITELKNGSKSAMREYAITFETPSDIPEKYISKTNDVLDGEPIQYTLFDRDTKKSEVVNFTTISKSNDATVSQNRKILCGSGPVFTKEFMEWPHSNRKRVEIRVSPKRQSLVASDCLEVNDNVEKISTLSPTRRDFDSTQTEPTDEASDETSTLNYPTSDSPNETTSKYTEIQPSGSDSDKVKEIEQIEYTVDSTTTTEEASSSPVIHESSPDPKVQYQELNSVDLEPNKTFLSLPKVHKHPEHPKKSDFNRTHPALTKSPIDVTTQLKSVTKVSTTKQPEVKHHESLEATKKLMPDNSSYVTATTPRLDTTLLNRTTGILKGEDFTLTDVRPVKVENTTGRDSNMNFTELAPHVETSFVTKDKYQPSEDSGTTESLNNIGRTEAPTKPPLYQSPTKTSTGSTRPSDKDLDAELKYSKVDKETPITDSSKEYLNSTPYKDLSIITDDLRATVHTKRPTEYSPVTNKYDKHITSQKKPKWQLSKTSQQVPELPKKVSNLPITEPNILKTEDLRVPQTVNDTSFPASLSPVSTPVTHWELPTEYAPIIEKDDAQAFPEKKPKWMSPKASEKPQKSFFLPTKVSKLPSTERTVEVEPTRVPQTANGTSVSVLNKKLTPLSTPVTHWELPVEHTQITEQDDTQAFTEKKPKWTSPKISEKIQKSSLLPTRVSNIPSIERTVEVEKTTMVPQNVNYTPFSVANKTFTTLATPVTHWQLPIEHTVTTEKDDTQAFPKKKPKWMSSKTSEKPQKSSLLPTKVSKLPSTEHTVEVEKTTRVPQIANNASVPVLNKTLTPLSTQVTQWELPVEYIPITAPDDTQAFSAKKPKGMLSKATEKTQTTYLLPTKVSNLLSTERSVEEEKGTMVTQTVNDTYIPAINKTSTQLPTLVTNWELPIEYTEVTDKDGNIPNLPSTERNVEEAEGTRVPSAINDTSILVFNKTFTTLSIPYMPRELSSDYPQVTKKDDTLIPPKEKPKWMLAKTSQKPQKSSFFPTKGFNLLIPEQNVDEMENTRKPQTVNDISIPDSNKIRMPLSTPGMPWELSTDHPQVTKQDDALAPPKEKSQKPHKTSLSPTKSSNSLGTERSVDDEESTRELQTVNDLSIPVFNKTLIPVSTPGMPWEVSSDHPQGIKMDDTLIPPKEKSKSILAKTSEKPQISSFLPTKVGNSLSTERNVDEEENTRKPQTVNDISIPDSNNTLMPLSTRGMTWEQSTDHPQITKKDDTLVPPKEKPKSMLAKTSENPQRSSVLPTKTSNLQSTELSVDEEENTKAPQTVNDISIPDSNKTLMPLSTPSMPWELSTEHPQVTKQDDTLVPPEEKPKSTLAKTSEKPQKSSSLPTKVVNLLSTERNVDKEENTRESQTVNDISIPDSNKTLMPLSTPGMPWELSTDHPQVTKHDDTVVSPEEKPKSMLAKTSQTPQKSSVLPTKTSNLQGTERSVDEEENTKAPQAVNDVSISDSNKTLMPLSTPGMPWELSTDYPQVTKQDDTLVPPEEKPKKMLAKTSEKPQKSSLLPTKISNIQGTERNADEEENTREPQTVNGISFPDFNRTLMPLSTPGVPWKPLTDHPQVIKKDGTLVPPKEKPKWMLENTSQKPQKSSFFPTKGSNLLSTERIVDEEESTRELQTVNDIPDSNKTLTPLPTRGVPWEPSTDHPQVIKKDDTLVAPKEKPKWMLEKTSQKPQKSSFFPTKGSNLLSTERNVEEKENTKEPQTLNDISIPDSNKALLPLSTPGIPWELSRDHSQVTKKDETLVLPEEKPKLILAKTSQKPEKSSFVPTKVSNLLSTERNVDEEESTREPQTINDIPDSNKTLMPLSTRGMPWEPSTDRPQVIKKNETLIAPKEKPKWMLENTSQKPQKSSFFPTKGFNLLIPEQDVDEEENTRKPQTDSNKILMPLSTPGMPRELSTDHPQVTKQDDALAPPEEKSKSMLTKISEKPQKSSLLPTKISNIQGTERSVDDEENSREPQTVNDISIPDSNKTFISLSTPGKPREQSIDHPQEIKKDDTVVPSKEKPKWMLEKTSQKPQKSSFFPTKGSNLLSTERNVDEEENTRKPQTVNGISIPDSNKTLMPLSTQGMSWELSTDHPQGIKMDDTLVPPKEKPKWMLGKTSQNPQESSFLPTKVSNLLNIERNVDEEENTKAPQTVNDTSIPDFNKSRMPLSTPGIPRELSTDHSQVSKKNDTLFFPKGTPKWILAKTSEKPQKSFLSSTKSSNLLSPERSVDEEERELQTVNDLSIPVFNKTFTPLSTPVMPWELSTDHPQVIREDHILMPLKKKPNWGLSNIIPKTLKTSVLPTEVSHLPSEKQNVIEERTTIIPQSITDNYEVNNTLVHDFHETFTSLPTPFETLSSEPTTEHPKFITLYDKTSVTDGQTSNALSLSPEHDKVMTTEQLLIATGKPMAKSTETDLETKPNSSSASAEFSTFNTPATKRLRSGGISILKSVTVADAKYPLTKTMKQKGYGIPKKNDEDQFAETHFKSSSTESVRPRSTFDIKKDTTVNKFENKSPTALRITLPSTRFLDSSSGTDILFPISKQKNQTKSVTTSLNQINDDLAEIAHTTLKVPVPILEPDHTEDTLSHASESYTTDRVHLLDAKETTVNDLKIVKEEHITTEISIISSQKYSTEDYIEDTSKQLIDGFESTTTGVSSQSAQKTELFYNPPRNYTSDYVLYKSEATTTPSKLKPNNFTRFYSSDDDTTTDNLINGTNDIETNSNIPRSTIANIDSDTFYGSTREDSSRDFIKSDNLIQESSSTPKYSIFESSARTDTDSSSKLYDSRTTKPSDIIDHVGTSRSFSKASSASLSDEMPVTKSDLEKSKHLKEKVVDSTDTYFSRSVDVSDNLPNQFEITTVGKPLLDERTSTKVNVEELTDVSPKPVSNYIILPESMTYYPKSFGKPIVFTSEKIKSNVYLTSSQAPSSAKHVSLKSTQKSYSHRPSVHPKGSHFTEEFASTDSLLDQFRATGATLKYPSEMVPIRNAPDTSPHPSTPKGQNFEHTLHSKSPSIHFKYTTSAESSPSVKSLDDYQVTSNHKNNSGLPFTNPSAVSSITDNKLSDKLVDMISTMTTPTLTQQIKQLNQEVSSELPGKHATSDTVSSWLFHKDSNNTPSEVTVLSTESLPLNSLSTNEQEQYISQFNSQRPSKHKNKTVLMEYSTSSTTLSEEFEGTTELLENKPTAKVHIGDFITSDSPEKLLEILPRSTVNLIEGDLFSSPASFSHPSDRYSSVGVTSPAPLLGQSRSSPKIQKENHLVSGFSTTRDTLTDPVSTIINMLPIFSTLHPSVGYQTKPTTPSKNLNDPEGAPENIPYSTKTTYSDVDIATSTRSSTEKPMHILKSLDKPLCTNAKQKISVRVKILMEHILEKNEGGTIKKQVIPIMGIAKRTEFDIKPKKRLPAVTQKKLNQDWNVFLDDLATNFFDFNRAAVKDYSELKPNNLNLNAPEYGFSGDILAPKENMQRMQQIRNWMTPCRRKHGNKASRGVSPSLYIMDENSTPFRYKYPAENRNSEMNLKLTTLSEEQLSTDFYRFLLGSSPRRSKSEVDNEPTKVGIPTTLMLPFSERSKMKMVKELTNWPRKPNVVFRSLQFMTPIPGSYRTGYKEFSLADLFPSSTISERSQYIPTIVYSRPTKVGPDLFPSYSSASMNRGYNGLPSYSPKLLIDVGPTDEEYRPGVNKNSEFERPATSSSLNNDADKEMATVKSFKRGHKIENENLNKTRINGKKLVKINKDNLHSKLGTGAESVKKDTNNTRNQASHKINLNGNPNTFKSENVNLHPTTENYKSQELRQRTIRDFKSILDGIINKLNAVLEKLTKR